VRNRSIDALLSTNRLRIFALDRYSETGAEYAVARLPGGVCSGAAYFEVKVPCSDGVQFELPSLR